MTLQEKTEFAAAEAPAESTALPFAILAEEMRALHRFYETCEDGQDYDVPTPMMKRLAVIGLVRRVTGNRYEFTDFGLSVRNGDFATPTDSAEPSLDECDCGYGCPPGCGCRHSGESPTDSAVNAVANLRQADIAIANRIVARLCDRGLLSMSIPVRPEDEDMVLSRIIEFAAIAPKADSTEPDYDEMARQMEIRQEVESETSPASAQVGEVELAGWQMRRSARDDWEWIKESEIELYRSMGKLVRPVYAVRCAGDAGECDFNGACMYACVRSTAQPQADAGVSREPKKAWTDTQVKRVYDNTPEIHKDVTSFAAFHRVTRLVEECHGISPAPKEQA